MITLRHHTVNAGGNHMEPFYDHILWAHDGVISVPEADALTVYYRGYSVTPEGKQLRTTVELDEEVKRQLTTSKGHARSGK